MSCQSIFPFYVACIIIIHYLLPGQVFADSFIGSLTHLLLGCLLIDFFFSLAQENKLKVALLDYLRKQHPEDTDKFSMVAHHFSMYREIAQTLEETAVKQLASLGDCFPGTYFARLL